MAWCKNKQPIIRDDEYGTMTLGEYRTLVGTSMDEHEWNMEEAATGGDTLRYNDERDALETDRDRWQFANCVERNPETPVRWNRW